MMNTQIQHLYKAALINNGNEIIQCTRSNYKIRIAAKRHDFLSHCVSLYFYDREPDYFR